MFWAIFEFIGIVLPVILGASWLALELIICRRLSRLEKLISAHPIHLHPAGEVPMSLR